MGSTKNDNKREFESYLEEYMLQTSEAEINAFWKRMDEVVENMPEEEKKAFFQDMINGIEESVKESKNIRHQLAASLPKTKKNDKLRQLLLQ